MTGRRTLEQRLADLDAQRARLAAQKRRQDTRQKIVIGAAMIAAAAEDSAVAGVLRGVLEARVIREIDRKAVAEVLGRLPVLPLPAVDAEPGLSDLERAAATRRRVGR
jgi:hypothetical protein